MLLLTALFALHTFLLMGTGTWSDLAMAGEEFGTTLYYVREGVLAAGFLLYAAFAQWRKPNPLSCKTADIVGVVLVVLFAGCALALQVSGQPVVCVAAALVIALLVGVSGGMAYERIALAAAKGEGSSNSQQRDACRLLGIIVGGGGAVAVALQYALQTGFSLGGWLAVCFVACFALIVWLARALRPESSESQGMENAGKGSLAVMPFVCLAVAATCLFSLLTFYGAVMRASGAVASLYEWHRLFLVVGYAIIGVAAYVGGRPAASVAILIAALFAIIVSAQTAMLEAGPLTTVLFYTLLGAKLAWSNIAFMSAAPQSRCPAFVASTGRVLVALVSLAESLFYAIGELSLMAVLVISLVLLAIVVVAMVKGGFLVFAKPEADGTELPEEEPVLSAEERMRQLARESGLSAREQDVLAALVLTEDKNQQIADELGISRRQLQNHISHIYEKTGATTRAGLVMRVNGES